MATPTLVQHTAKSVNTTTGAETGGNTFKYSLPNKSLANNCLVFALSYAFNAARTVTITDDQSNSWPTTPTVTVTDAGNVITTSLFVLPNAAANTQKIQVVFDASTLYVQGEISEFYNVATSSPANGTTSNNASVDPTVTAGSFTPGNNNANGGNLIYNYAVNFNGSGILGPNATPTSIVAGTNFHLEATDYNLAIAVQTWVQATSAAVNPTLTFNGLNNGNTFNSVAVALKAATAGTAPGTGIRIVHEMTANPWGPQGEALPWTFGFPTSGNLIVGLMDVVRSGSANVWSATSDGTNTWTHVALGATNGDFVPQCWYAANATSSFTMKITLTVAGTPGPNIEWHFYDIAGAATSPFDVEADAADTGAGVTGNITGAPSITPSTANGLVLACLVLGTGPTQTIQTTGGIFDNVPYTGESDGSTINNGDGWQHVFNTNTSAISFAWNLVNTSSWGATAVAFKAAPASGIPPLGIATPDDFPNPIYSRYPVDLRTFLQSTNKELIGKDKFFGAAGQGPNYDWPNPRGPAYPSDLRTFLNATETQLIGKDVFFRGPGQAPNYDYPNPQPLRWAFDLKTWLQFLNNTTLSIPFFQTNWPNPLPTRFPIENITFIDTLDPQLISLDKFFGAPGQVPPQRDWPNPLPIKFPGELRTWLQSLSQLVGKDIFFGGAGQPPPNRDFPNPLPTPFASDLRTWLLGHLLSDTLRPNFIPFNLTDWPNPKIPGFPLDLRTWFNGTIGLRLSRDTFFGAPGQSPANLDWPNPRGPAFPIDLRTWLWNPLENTLNFAAPFFLTDWPNPLPQRFAQDLRTWLIGNLQNTTLQGQDLKPFSDRQFPNPLIPFFSNELRTWVQSPSQQSIIPFSLHDWPNPTVVNYPSALRTFLFYYVLAPGNMPFQQFDFPNPTGAQYPLSLRDFIVLNLLETTLGVPGGSNFISRLALLGVG